MTSVRWRVSQWFELLWWKNYLHGKKKEEYLAWKKSYWKNILSLVSDEIKLNPSKTIIDLGCGPAGAFIAVPENKVTAVDPLIDEYESQTPFLSKSDYPNVAFIKSTIEDFEGIASQNLAMTFDLVFCMNCINHVNDIEKGFTKLKEVCAVNGALVLSIDAHNFYFFKHLFRLIPGDILHPHQYDLTEYKIFVEKQGFKILKTELLKQEFLFGHWVLVASK
jgi:2-polyprenyl-6-hydroxyphenyl methylase/3-demethylubiquinone-9 3-methyltransferase